MSSKSRFERILRTVEKSLHPNPGSSKPVFDWIDTPWTVAALLGVWGVMIGIEEFYLANVFIFLAAAVCVVRLFKDVVRKSPRRKGRFLIGALIIGSIVAVDVRLTGKKKLASEARSLEIPGLQQKIRDLQGAVDKQNTKSDLAQAQSDQKLADIEEENKNLQKSVETKDAALVAIARQQYALNYVPQIAVVYDSTNEMLQVVNRGKTNIEVWGGKLGNEAELIKDKPTIVAPDTYEGYYTVKENLTRDAVLRGTSDGFATYDGKAFIRTLDNKKYIVSYKIRLNMVAGEAKRIDVFSDGLVMTDWASPKPK
jgi:hypothetical protein